MWAFMSCSTDQTTHVVGLRSHFLSFGIWSAELVAFWFWVGFPIDQLKNCKTTWSRKSGRPTPLWSHDHTWCPDHDGNFPVSLKTCNKVPRMTWMRFCSYSSRASKARNWSCKARWRAYLLSIKKDGRSSWSWAKLWVWSLVRAMELSKVEKCADVMTKWQVVMDGHCNGRVPRSGTKNCKKTCKTCSKEVQKSNFRQYGHMKSRDGKSQRREEKRREEKRGEEKRREEKRRGEKRREEKSRGEERREGKGREEERRSQKRKSQKKEDPGVRKR